MPISSKEHGAGFDALYTDVAELSATGGGRGEL